MSRATIYSVGINDADYAVNPQVDGKRQMCPYYLTWTGMLKRCYDPKYHAKNPTYTGCTVCDEWLVFSNFKKWMKKQGWRGMQLDKDILVDGNKIYSAKYCRFVSSGVNLLLTDRGNARGGLPIGVYQSKGSSRFMARCRVLGTLTHIGTYDTPEEAHTAYLYSKAEAIRLTVEAEAPIDEIRIALLDRANKMIAGLQEKENEE